MSSSTPSDPRIWTGAITVTNLDDEIVSSVGAILHKKIDEFISEHDYDTWGKINSFGEFPIRWGWREIQHVVDRSKTPDPHEVALVARGFDAAQGSAIANREQERHYDGSTTSVSSILVTGSDCFRIWASPTVRGFNRASNTPDPQLILKIDRQPGVEVHLDQTASITSAEHNWHLEHDIVDCSESRVSLILRRLGRLPWVPGQAKTRAYRRWPGGGHWFLLSDGVHYDLTHHFALAHLRRREGLTLKPQW